MFEKVKQMIAEQLSADESTLTEETSFKDDLGADSLDLFQLVMAMEDEFKVEIPSEDLEKLATVGDVMKYLKDKGVEERYPILQGGMAWVAEQHLAAAVSEAGGLGLIGGASAPGEVIRDMLRDAKRLTSAQVGVNVMLMSPHADDVARVVIEEGVKVVTTGAGMPTKYMEDWKKAGVKVIPVVASVAQARMMERLGADAVVAEGTESGGHIGEATTMCLLPQVVDAVSIPVIGAGGIADGRGMMAAFMLGAEAVQIGTRFVASTEAVVSDAYKNRIVKSKDIDSAVTGRTHGHPVRSLRNDMTREYARLEAEGKSFEELEYLTLGSLRKAVQEGDVIHGTVMAGQIAGLIRDVKPCREIIEDMMRECQTLARKAADFV